MNKIYLQHAGISEALLIPLGETLTRHSVDAGLFRLAGYDALGSLKRLHQPILGLFPEYDRSSPPGESLQLYAKALNHGNNRSYELHVISNADHMMHPSNNGFDPSPVHHDEPDPVLVPEYLEIVTSWIYRLDTDQAETDSIDTPPDQPIYSSALAPIAVHESGIAQGIGLVVLLLTFGSYPVGAFVTHVRYGHTTTPTRWPARAVATLGLSIPFATLGYLGYIMFTAATAMGPIVLGRPLPWLVLQLGTVAMLCCGSLMVLQWWRYRKTLTQGLAWRFTLLTIGLIALVPWATYWGLFAF